MSAINIRIEWMTRQRSLSVVVAAYVYAALIVAGPWIFTMLGIVGLSVSPCFECRDQLPLFRSVIIYNSLFSLIVTSPLAFFAGRYVSDQLYVGQQSGIFSLFLAVLAIFVSVSIVTVVPFYLVMADLDGPTRFAAVQNVFLIAISWLLIPFMSAMRAAIPTLMAFASNALMLIVVGSFLKEPSAVTLLTAFNGGFAMTDMILLGTLVRRFGCHVEPHLKRSAFRWSQWELPAAGLAYAVGIWSDKLVMWYGASSDGLVVANVLHTMPSYDTAMFWAQMASIPVTAIAFVHVDTGINNLFRRFYGRLGQHTSFREISTAIQVLQKCVISSVATLFVALAVVATLTILLSFVFMNELGLRPSYLRILRIALWAMAFHSSAMFCFVYLLYFDLRRQALLVVAIYGIANTALTWLLLPLGQVYYGYGSMIAAAFTFILAFAIILHELPWLHYHAFITNNVSVNKT